MVPVGMLCMCLCKGVGELLSCVLPFIYKQGTNEHSFSIAAYNCTDYHSCMYSCMHEVWSCRHTMCMESIILCACMHSIQGHIVMFARLNMYFITSE